VELTPWSEFSLDGFLLARQIVLCTQRKPVKVEGGRRGLPFSEVDYRLTCRTNWGESVLLLELLSLSLGRPLLTFSRFSSEEISRGFSCLRRGTTQETCCSNKRTHYLRRGRVSAVPFPLGCSRATSSRRLPPFDDSRYLTNACGSRSGRFTIPDIIVNATVAPRETHRTRDTPSWKCTRRWRTQARDVSGDSGPDR